MKHERVVSQLRGPVVRAFTCAAGRLGLVFSCVQERSQGGQILVATYGAWLFSASSAP